MNVAEPVEDALEHKHLFAKERALHLRLDKHSAKHLPMVCADAMS